MESVSSQKDDATAEYDLLDTALDYVYRVGKFTAPDISIGFIGFLVVVSALHETDTRVATGFVIPWLVIQLLAYVTTKNFRNQLFWSILGLIGNIFFYLLIGHCWTYVKLFVEVSQRRIILKDTADIGSFLDEHKWLIANWTVQWPASILYTLSKDPFRIISDTLSRYSRDRYIWIVSSALSSTDTNTLSPWWIVAYVSVYFLCGFIWTHVKLFIDVWQRNIDDPVLEEMIHRRNYHGFYLAIKWTVLQWMFIWPFSATYNIIRYPMRIFAEFIYHISERRYIWVTQKAAEMRQ